MVFAVGSGVLPGAAAHVYWAELIVHTQPWFVALAAQMAGEGQAPRTNALLRQGLQQHYGLDEKALRFCRTHEEADVEHSSLSELIVRRYDVKTLADVVWRTERRAGMRFLQFPEQQQKQLERWLQRNRLGMSTGYSYAAGF